MKKINLQIILPLVISLFLLGCVTSPNVEEKRNRVKQTIPACSGEQDWIR
jgi:hypothetical protein